MRKEGGREGRAKVAVAARRLMSLAKEVEGVESAEAVSAISLFAASFERQLTEAKLLLQTRDTIEKYCERFEKDMLKLFDKYYRRGDPKAMAVSRRHSLFERALSR